ncbi:S8 family peptidase [Thiocystis violacea]|uniref:S8 family peptidase n=1 Tax=Thiocystis violacea TaxID=13725 RepID=UPI0019058373|nr:S8 family serine peptidase [Thiocystis violacea]MBK1723201.1 hypothetical protein [Thiocystis violacea]
MLTHDVAGAADGDLFDGWGSQAKWSVLPALVNRARAKGRIRVLVGFDVQHGFLSEGRWDSTDAVIRQRASIASAQSNVADLLAGLQAQVRASFKYVPGMALELDADALEVLASLPQVRWIEEDVPTPPTMESSNLVIGAESAWAMGYDGSGQVVAVLDTGIDKTHPFFSTGGNKVVSEACYSTTAATYGSTSLCPGGVAESVAVGSGVNCSTAISGCKDGTHTAGIVAGNDGIGPNFGVAPGADLVSIQVFSRIEGTACGSRPSPCALSYKSDQVKGLERVYELRHQYAIAAVNMSLAGGCYNDQNLCDADNALRKAAIDNLRNAGIATVVSSGNSLCKDSIGAPACISSAISVGATDDDDVVAEFSNVAPFMSLLAPGSSITSSVPGGGTETLSGTSMAAPHVAGAWAVLRQSQPKASVDVVLESLQATGASVDDSRSGGQVTDMRRINVDLALGLECSASSISLAPGLFLGIGEVRSGNDILTSGNLVIASDAAVSFNAGRQIRLNKGFAVRVGGLFQARIGPVGCPTG